MGRKTIGTVSKAFSLPGYTRATVKLKLSRKLRRRLNAALEDSRTPRSS